MSDRRPQPLTLHMDVANWIELADRREDSGPLDKAIADGRIVPVLSLVHLLELAVNEEKIGRNRVADYIDAVSTVKWIKSYSHLVQREATACFKEINGGRWDPPLELFDSFHQTLDDAVLGKLMIVGDGVPRRTAEILDYVAANDEFPKLRDDCLRYRDTIHRVERIRRVRGAKRRFTKDEKCHWLAESLPDQVEMALGRVAVTDDLRKRFERKVDLAKCPAFRASWAFHEGANLDPKRAHKNDLLDSLHLTGVAYCDVAFADKATVETLRQGRYDKLPKRNSEFAKWIRNLT